MGAALDDLPVLEHQNLVGALDGGQSVGNDERGAAAAQGPQPVLDHRLAFTVEAGSRLVEDQEPRVRQNRPGDGDTLALPARQLDAPLADDRIVAVRKLLDELVAVRDAADLLDLGAGGVPARKTDIRGDRPVEQEVLLQHDPQLPPVVSELQRRQIPPVHQDPAFLRPVERHHQADQRALPGPARPDQRGRRAGRRRQRDVAQHLHSFGVGERHMLELDIPRQHIDRLP